jgi:HSP20 family molecular chaperone IbpA
VEEDKVEATYKDGVLTLTMPKAEKKEIKKIEISDN